MKQRHNITALLYDKKGRLLSIGKNSYEQTHPLQARCAAAVGLSNKVFLHAEVAALVKLKDWSKAHRMVVTRYTKDGKPANAKPCPSCQYAIKLANINYVEHT